MAARPVLSMVTDMSHPMMGYPTPAHSPSNQKITCWLVDTRRLWPGDNILTATGASAALALVSPAERQAITTKLFIQDARMSLASALIKRLYICRTLGLAWEDVRLGRKDDPKHGKPCAVDATGQPLDGIDFNVSHQGGLVALIGYDGRSAHDFTPSGMVYALISPTTNTPRVNVGVDIVCVNERDDYRTIDADGFDGWVDMYDCVFSGEERWSMKYDVDRVTLLDGSVLGRDEIGRHDRCIDRNQYLSIKTPAGRQCSFSSERIIEAKLRRFYTYFCYKEAYIKLAGEALLAPWLRQLEFFNVRSPKPGVQPRCSTHGTWGEVVEDVEVLLHGKPVQDVRIKIQAFEEDFMLSTAMQGEIAGLKLPAFQPLDLMAEVQGTRASPFGKTMGSAPQPPPTVRVDSVTNVVSMCRDVPADPLPAPVPIDAQHAHFQLLPLQLKTQNPAQNNKSQNQTGASAQSISRLQMYTGGRGRRGTMDAFSSAKRHGAEVTSVTTAMIASKDNSYTSYIIETPLCL